MKERKVFEIEDIGRDFLVKGPIEAIVKPKGFVKWCKAPYPDHPDGCPNFGNRDNCPPKVRHFLDEYKPQIYLAFMRFDFEEYLNIKRKLHPDWTEKARRNNRHYQNHLDSQLIKFVDSQLEKPEFQNLKAVYCSEAMGVNLHLTSYNAGVKLEWPPENNNYRIAVLAQPL